MSERRLPVRPDLKQLRNQAKDLLRAIRAKEEPALAELRQFHPHPPDPLRETVRAGNREEVHEHRDVTPLGWGKVFHNRTVVSEPAMKLIQQHGGHF